MPERVGQRWLIALVPVLFVLAIVLLHRITPDRASILAHSIIRSLHAPGFALAALVILLYLHWQNRTLLNYVLAGAAAMSIGVLSEIAQIPGPRDAQFKDLLVDGIGVFGGLGAAALWDRDVRALLKPVQLAVVALLSAAALVFSVWSTAWLGYSMLQRYRAMPELLSFEHAWERNVFAENPDKMPFIIDAPEHWPGPGEKVAFAREAGRHGIFLRLHPYPDWSQYSSLSFLAASSSAAVHDVTVQIRDIRPGRGTHHNKFFTKIVVGPEPTRFLIPFEDILKAGGDRPFELDLVEAFVLSASRPGGEVEVEVLFDDIRLH